VHYMAGVEANSTPAPPGVCAGSYSNNKQPAAHALSCLLF